MAVTRRSFKVTARHVEARDLQRADGSTDPVKLAEHLNRVIRETGSKVEEALAHLSAGNVDLPSKGKADGIAALNASIRVQHGTDTTDDLIVDDAKKGFVLKGPAGKYFRVTMTDTGALTTAALTKKP